MKNLFWPLAVLIVVVGAGVALVVLPGKSQAPTTATSTPTTSTNPYADLIKPGLPVVSPTTLTINGQARGTWYFEASFPMMLKDASGATIAQGPAQAQDAWMTEDFVPFAGTLSYPAQPTGSHGTLILKNDNPSGDPARDKSVSIPVTF